MDRSYRARLTRRAAIASGLGFGATTLAPRVLARQATPAVAPDPDEIVAIAGTALADLHLRAVLLRVQIDDREIVTHALGESISGRPATVDMHVRNGAVAITYISTLLLRLVDDGIVALDDTIDRWLPDMPDADQVTPRMLANMTAGYPDYVPNPEMERQLYADPYRAWTPDELLAFSFAAPRLFAPGENWDYSHANYVVLGLALEAATGRSLDDLLRAYILDPLELHGTASEQTGWMPEPVLHAFSSERRGFFGIADDAAFYEESTFWNPSWTLPRGGVQYTTITDMARSFAAIGRGDLLSPESYEAQVGGQLLGFGAPLEGCRACHTLDEVFFYGLGIVQSGTWLLQNPLFSGYAGTVGHHPESGITIAVATTFAPEAFDAEGGYANGSTQVLKRIAEYLLPSDPPLLG